jgi:hypothetical protein
VAQRAGDFYQLARETLPEADRRSMVAAELMGSVYWRLLRKLERQRFQVFGPEPTRLNRGHKAWLVLRTWSWLLAGVGAPGYGPVAQPKSSVDSPRDEPCACTSPTDRQR